MGDDHSGRRRRRGVLLSPLPPPRRHPEDQSALHPSAPDLLLSKHTPILGDRTGCDFPVNVRLEATLNNERFVVVHKRIAT